MELLEKDVEFAKPEDALADVTTLYEGTFLRIAKFVSSMGGSFDDAKDIFHDALVIYFEQMAQKRVSIRISEAAYILGIAKHLWLRKFNYLRSNILLDDLEREIVIPEDYYPDVNTKHLLRILETAGKKCMDLLRAFYYQDLPVRNIAKNLGYANEHTASVQKYKCLEKVRETIKQKSITYDDLVA